MDGVFSSAEPGNMLEHCVQAILNGLVERYSEKGYDCIRFIHRRFDRGVNDCRGRETVFGEPSDDAPACPLADLSQALVFHALFREEIGRCMKWAAGHDELGDPMCLPGLSFDFNDVFALGPDNRRRLACYAFHLAADRLLMKWEKYDDVFGYDMDWECDYGDPDMAYSECAYDEYLYQASFVRFLEDGERPRDPRGMRCVEYREVPGPYWFVPCAEDDGRPDDGIDEDEEVDDVYDDA